MFMGGQRRAGSLRVELSTESYPPRGMWQAGRMHTGVRRFDSPRPKTHEKSFDTWILPLMAMDFLSPPALDTAQCRWRYCLIFWSSPNIAAPSRDSSMRNPADGLCQHGVVTIIHLTWEIASILSCGPLPRLVVGIDQCLIVTEGRRSNTAEAQPTPESRLGSGR